MTSNGESSTILRTAPTAAVCPLCGGTRTRVAFADVPSLERCVACGLVWGREPFRGTYEGTFLTESGYYAEYFRRAGQWRREARLRLSWLLAHTRPSLGGSSLSRG